jgi:hypothetical protein
MVDGNLTYPLTLYSPPYFEHSSFFGSYGYSSVVVRPFLATYFKALDGIPPLHPRFP